MKLDHYTVEFKKKLIAFAEGTSNLAVRWCYGIDETNLRRWKKEKEQLYTAWRMMLFGRTVIVNYQLMTLVTQCLVMDSKQS
jgi:hypothetical protein